MSRGVRDLRDLICVSRLTIRDSDEELSWDSDEDRQSQVTSDGRSSGASSRQGSGQSRNSRCRGEVVSPDSGICPTMTNGDLDGDVGSRSKSWTSKVSPHPPSATKVGGMRRKKKKATKVSDFASHSYDLPKPAVLPPVKSKSMDYNISSSDEDVTPKKSPVTGNFDDMLMHIDATLISDWLMQSNASVTDLATWCHTGDNFVQFAHFWLSDFSEPQKQNIFKLETSILLDHLSFAFAPGKNSGKVKHVHLVQFLEAVFREYPGKLFSTKGPYLFLDILDVLSSERQSMYKKVLTDVKVSTRVKQHAQWCLAIRSFALVSVWTAVVNFYRRLLPESGVAKSLNMPMNKVGQTNHSGLRVQQSIRNGFVDVVSYLIQTGKIRPDYKDEHKKSLIFSAVMHNQANVLNFLLSQQTGAQLYVNDPADNGNTPLHAAANLGYTKMVNILLSLPGTVIDAENAQCDGATPLHLATMQGHVDVVEQLLAVKADHTKQMGDLLPITIAQDFGHDDIVEVLKKYTS